MPSDAERTYWAAFYSMQALRLAQHRKVNHRLCQAGRKDAAQVICPEGMRDKTRAQSPAFCIEWFRPAEGRAQRQRCRGRPDEGTAKKCAAPPVHCRPAGLLSELSPDFPRGLNQVPERGECLLLAPGLEAAVRVHPDLLRGQLLKDGSDARTS